MKPETITEYRIRYSSKTTANAITDIFAHSKDEARQKFVHSHGEQPRFIIHSVDVLQANKPVSELSAIDKMFHI